jgi:predicted nuclease of predicted toxin-antitoxin system
MALLYADEQFPRIVVELLRALGHDVLTVQEARNANLGIPDEDVLAFAVTNERAVLTLNRIDFIRLHASQPNHAGIIVCKDDQQNRQRMATRISEAISNLETLRGMLVRVNRPSR